MVEQYYRYLTPDEKLVNWLPEDSSLTPDELEKKASRIRARLLAESLDVSAVVTDSAEK